MSALPKPISALLSEVRPRAESRLLSPPAVFCAAAICLVVIFFGVIRYRLRDMPLERDEGEYAYAGQLLLQHIPPYKLAYNMKLPGIYAAYATILAVFGETPGGIHSGLLLVNALTIVLMFFLAAHLFGRLAGLIAATSYALLSTSSSVMGFEAHATHFVVLAAVAGILLLLRAMEHRGTWLLLVSGALADVAVLMKQHGAFFALFCGLYLVAKEWKAKAHFRRIFYEGAIFSCGVILPYLFTCLFLYRAGVFSAFWFWTVSYAGEYSKVGWDGVVSEFLDSMNSVTDPVIPLWILAGFGLTALAWGRAARRSAGFLAGLFLFSFLSICPGGYFREHYFILLLPVLSLLIAVGVVSVMERVAPMNKWILTFAPIVIFLGCFANGISRQSDFYFHLSPQEAVQSTYSAAPFIAAQKVAEFVKASSPAAARIAVFGSEPEIYFYSQRHSATGYLYLYPLTEDQKYISRMQEQFIHEVETNRPEYVVDVDYPDSWGDIEPAPHQSAFLAWTEDYMRSNYERVAIADGANDIKYIWGDAAKTYQPHTDRVIYVLKRNH